MIETTLLKKNELLGPNRSKIFDDDILENIPEIDVAVCTGIWFSRSF